MMLNTLPAAVQISFRVDTPSKRGMDVNKFTVSSRTKNAAFVELKSETAKDTDADPATKSGVRIRVGAKDTLILATGSIDPDVYVGMRVKRNRRCLLLTKCRVLRRMIWRMGI